LGLVPVDAQGRDSSATKYEVKYHLILFYIEKRKTKKSNPKRRTNEVCIHVTILKIKTYSNLKKDMSH
jgi:hypothetical protein